MDATVFLFALYDEASETVQVVRQMDRGAEYPAVRSRWAKVSRAR